MGVCLTIVFKFSSYLLGLQFVLRCEVRILYWLKQHSFLLNLYFYRHNLFKNGAYQNKAVKGIKGIQPRVYGKTKLDLKRIEEIAKVLEIDPIKMLSFNSDMIFNDCKNFGGQNYYAYSEKERELYEARINALEEDKVYLKAEIKRLQGALEK